MAPDPIAEARRYLLLDEPERAQSVLERVLAEQPDHGPALALMAYARLQTGALDLAERDARLAFAHAELRPDAAALLARITMSRDPIEATGWASEAVRLDPARSEFRIVLARILRERRLFEPARVEADAALANAASDDERTDALITASSIAVVHVPRRAEALRLAEEAARISPTDPRVGQMLAAAQVMNGQRAAAIRTARRVLSENPLARTPPYLAQVATALMVRQLIGLITILTALVPFFTFAMFAQALGASAGSRLGAAVGLVCTVVISVGTLNPLRDRAVVRAMWLFARQRAIEVVSVVTVAVIAMGYLVIALTGFFPLIAMLPFLSVAVWTVHEVKLTQLRPPVS